MGSQGREMNTLIIKKILRNNLDEYLQERMAYVKYHHAEARQKMMQLYGEGTKRGLKRQLEKKKFFLLGQIQTMRTLFTSYVESGYSEDLLQGDVFYAQVF